MYKESQTWRTFDKERYDYYNQKVLLYADSTTYYNDLENEAKANFIPKFNGYVMKHSFRAKNKNGNFEMSVLAFLFNKELTNITSTCDWNEYIIFDAEKEMNSFINELLNE